ncbi:MAG TPA: sensor histidine kinase [Rhodoglobus sp.]|nr:sensor histidine kinase [Rhodoglobus sp.]
MIEAEMTTDTQRRRRGYGALWAATPRETLYLIAVFPVMVVGFGLTIGLFSAGVGTLATFFIGILFLIACLYVARGIGTVDLALLEVAGRPRIRRPDWKDDQARTGFFGWVRAVLGNGHYWLYTLHSGLIGFVVSTVSFTITVTWFAVALGGLTAWIWYPFIPDADRGFFISEWLFWALGLPYEIDGVLGDVLLQLALGIVFALTFPLVTRGLVLLHWVIARGVLGAFRSEALEQRVTTLAQQQDAAQSAEGHSLRRLERDIHDGPQQRLVRLQMDLAAAERQLDADPDRARILIAEAMQQSKDALEELRALSRGFAPPILLDRGLVAALESAAIRNPVPTRVVDGMPEGLRLPTELERNAYFIAIEAITNAVKHAGASDIEVRVSTDAGGALQLTVTDDGAGGAVSTPGHGIAGLEDRVRGLGGALEVLSPPGGPTVVTARLPLPAVF